MEMLQKTPIQQENQWIAYWEKLRERNVTKGKKKKKNQCSTIAALRLKRC